MKQTVWKNNKNGSATIYVPANQTAIMAWIISEGVAGLEGSLVEYAIYIDYVFKIRSI
jgi:hypothetical protein